ncbi:MAG: 2-oxoacid:acceptor oxidoreductase family protein [Planctomycetales bacterium]|nr:2-oxoacid:acceptor oxidoreductase family protein [bacterium]UNM07288.1 MAG: 2-oxoacid:acceptor oxidoreductase family protein [Planctomycetales bacterium]
MKSYNIFISGVGGQGIGLLAEVLIQSCLAAGYAVLGVDTHGLAQRGGIVVSHLRIGNKDKLFTPRITPGEADLIVGLERLEAYRGIVNYMRDGGTCIYYDAEQQPIHVRMGLSQYPSHEELEKAVAERHGKVERVFIEDLPDVRMQNTAVLGRIASFELVEGLTGDIIREQLLEISPSSAKDANLKVFEQASAARA